MKVFAVSDVHLEYDENSRWLSNLSRSDYRRDVLILGGDLANELRLLTFGFRCLTHRFRKVLYVPGNHELWLTGDCGSLTSMDKFARVRAIAADHGVAMSPVHEESLWIVPLLAWYDFSFGQPSANLLAKWSDFRACRWPDAASAPEIADRFLALNEPLLYPRAGMGISFSHFVPRLDLMPDEIPPEHRELYPVLGSTRLEEQIRRLGSAIHVYGHSHVNRDLTLDGIRYINNAFGYPAEARITAKRLRCVYED